jgi:hypothetical protein
VEAFDARFNYALIGGQNHPYHRPIADVKFGESTLYECLAVAGTSQLMPWDVWDEYGPLDAHAPGVCQSEDTAFCNRIREGGASVGMISPAVVYDTGISQTDGSPSIGSSQKERVEGVLYL